MDLIAYYEGDESVTAWFDKVVPSHKVTYKKMPQGNATKDYAELPAYVSDILYLDKPDLIISMNHDGHQKPLLSIEFANCTPQYQHALQRFSRMLASASTGCPSVLIMPFKKRSNSGDSVYTRSTSIEYGSVKLMDIFNTPCFIFDWETDENFYLKHQAGTTCPPLDSDSTRQLMALISSCIESRKDINYSESLSQKKVVHELTDRNRANAYRNGVPSIENPSAGDKKSRVKLDLIETKSLLGKISDKSPIQKALCDNAPSFIKEREKSLVFYPTRIIEKSGDPYVGMLSYYDIAFTRYGKDTRERHYNLVAYVESKSIRDVTEVMSKFAKQTCPFTKEISGNNSKIYNYHLKKGCKETKTKPVRVYAELADIVIFEDGVLFNAG